MRTSRRRFLFGAGTVAVALPFLEEMAVGRTALGAPGEVPDRLVTAFFGLGLDPSWQHDFDGPLEPYRPFADRMATFSVDMPQGTIGGAHCNTSAIVFVGEAPRSADVAGGPSLDQRVRRALDPTAATLVSGLWWRRGACDAQALRVFHDDGSARPPIKRPSEVFDAVFGRVVPAPPPGASPEDEAARRRLRTRRSILDTVMGEYRHLTGERSPLGVASRRKIDQHLGSIREIETQLAPADAMLDGGGASDPGVTCDVPDRPSDPPIADYDRFTYGTGDGAPEIHWQDVERVFHLHADLYALALRCDLVRYGNLMFESAGGHMNLVGTYSAMGDTTDFPGTSQHDSYFHGDQRHHARLYQHFAQTNLAYFLSRLDDPAFPEENGGTVLDNATVVIGTEYGWNHDKNQAFHAVVGGGGRFRAGSFTDRRMNCIDLYNAVLEGYGLPADVGAATGVASTGDASGLLA